MAKTRELAHAHAQEMICLRRDLHRWPEESGKEYKTTDRICEELDKIGLTYRRLDPTGVIADIVGNHPGPIVALRSDIDGLTVNEKTGFEFASENEGVMHACGHDVHTSVLVSAAKVLNEMKDEMHGTVRLIFQPAEEIATGAQTVIKAGGLDGVSMIFGMHNSPAAPAGHILGLDGCVFAAADQFKITVHGKVTHGAVPQDGVDAIVCASAIVSNLQTMVSREFDPMKPLVVTVGKIYGGTRWNVGPGEVTLEGTVRSTDIDIWKKVPETMERIAKETAAAYRATVDFEIHRLTKVLYNDEKATAIALNAAKKIVDDPETMVGRQIPTMGGEDYADYTNEIPGAFFLCGSGADHPWHSDYYNPDEECIEAGAAMYAQTALDMLEALK